MRFYLPYGVAMISNTNQLELFQEYLNTESDFAIYPCVQSTQARAAHKAMREVIEKLTTPFISEKKDVLLIGPYRLNSEGKRANINVEAVSALIFDIDEPQGYHFEDIVKLASPYSGVLHTTWSHTKEKPKYRLFITLSSEIPASQFKTVRDGFLNSNPWLAAIADKACSDISRAYYLFSHPQERADIAQCCVLIGRPVNPSSYCMPTEENLSITAHSPSLDATTLSLMRLSRPPSESTAEIEKLNAALTFLPSNIGYGSGRFYDSSGSPESDYWLAGIWAIASLNWLSGKDIARKWSEQSDRYLEDGFEKAWSSYNPTHPNAIGIGSLYKRAMELGWNQNTTPDNPGQPLPRFTLLGINDLAALPPTDYLIKGVLPSSGIAAIFGPSGSGKTFVALDLIMSIACQSDWFGHKVKNAPVTYIGLEGKSGINNRIKAWQLKNNLSPNNFKVILNRLDLRKLDDVNALALAIRDTNMAAGVVVIDTLNQATPGADENSSIDMGLAINRLQHLQELLGGLVLIIHHTGKNVAQGLRGHSSLKAALDANIEVVGGIKKMIVLDKVKDGKDGQAHPFKLVTHNLGIDSDGDPISSCTVERDHSVIFSKPEPSGGQQKTALKAIKNELANAVNKRITVEAAISLVASTLTSEKPNKRTNRSKSIVTSLITSEFLSSELVNEEGWIWLPQ